MFCSILFCSLLFYSIPFHFNSIYSPIFLISLSRPSVRLSVCWLAGGVWLGLAVWPTGWLADCNKSSWFVQPHARNNDRHLFDGLVLWVFLYHHRAHGEWDVRQLGVWQDVGCTDEFPGLQHRLMSRPRTTTQNDSRTEELWRSCDFIEFCLVEWYLDFCA